MCIATIVTGENYYRIILATFIIATFIIATFIIALYYGIKVNFFECSR